ncbi:DUF1097 domain-containing protein [Nocardioides sp. Leaf307]|uniref:DUF1097 domain-containing protein n=1 Tax=Nocardioides sp. Leaf307 TaxID=1736331 RepID=UPI000702CC00|nr:DUF1097 domain-containing protein [Nocardioides sp. Leaf307]KQQ43971.1 hypothetical protein ASF50_09045 [Nocardioides sp. Leaf307]
MKGLLGIGASVGLLAGAWTWVSVEAGLITWIAFVAWACFFAAGGGTEGLRKGLAANLAGLAWGYVISLVLELDSATWVLALSVTVVGFILCVESAWSVLSFIPGAFAGTAVFFGSAFDLTGSLVAILAGAALGLVSALLGARIQAAVDHHGSGVRPAAGPTPGAPAPA